MASNIYWLPLCIVSVFCHLPDLGYNIRLKIALKSLVDNFLSLHPLHAIPAGVLFDRFFSVPLDNLFNEFGPVMVLHFVETPLIQRPN